ncbi:hypothetical protein AXF42_Ash002605 [Apostasia shenzhenica]|uniref:DDE Tnp4 domain-containing protein n=1 Tax=Apostasia shenzhenica TaxID=1088818 RepID=A0A2I0AP07_9ASPA|nr:hypothetical protein AXF42_Ash002605 [Apostasia shenzhenica]
MKIPPPVSPPHSYPPPFPPPLEDDFSYYYTFFQDAAPSLPSSPAPPEMPPARRRRTDESEPGRRKKKKRTLARIITSLAALEGQEESDRRESEDDLSLLRANHDRKSATMLDYYSRLQDHYSDLEDADSLRAAQVRTATSAAAASAVAEGMAEGGGAAQQQQQQQQRRLWVKDRSRAWWDQCSHPDFPDAEFRRSFRMGRGTFDMICEALGAAVAKEDTMLRAAIPVQQRVAVCIWRLATGEPLRLVSKRFGLGISTCHKLVLEVCSAIRNVLMPRFLQWPDSAAAAAIKVRFESIAGIPDVLGSMYTTHIPIIAPKISVAAYYNRRHTERNQKTSYSITVQGVIDPDGVFTDVCIGWPGSMPDDQVLENSALYHRAEEKGMLRNSWIVGNSGHPLLDWVLVPYTHQNLTWTQHAFNEKIGEVQRIAREAFARLKGRWSCLQKRTEVKLQDLPVVLGACCVLHNICEIRKEAMEPELKFELVDDEMVPENSLRSVSSMQARDNIAHNLLHRGLAGTKFF